MGKQIEALVIARPSRFRNSIHLLLASMAPIEKIHLVDDTESALSTSDIPAVAILDADTGKRSLSVDINQIRTAWPQAGLIILVEDELQYQVAQAAGADILLRKGFPAARFIEAVQSFLSE